MIWFPIDRLDLVIASLVWHDSDELILLLVHASQEVLHEVLEDLLGIFVLSYVVGFDEVVVFFSELLINEFKMIKSLF